MHGPDMPAAALWGGFLLGLAFILSIGPQNLMLIEAGLARRHALAVATTGYLSEVAVVVIGIAALGSSLAAHPTAGVVLRGAGFLFLAGCGLRAVTQGGAGVSVGPKVRTGRRQAVLAMLAVTWLNPLVYVEVMLLGGTLSTSFGRNGATWFGVGFLVASAIKFYGWASAGRLLSPLFAAPGARRAFDLMAGGLLLATAGLLAARMAGWA